MKKWMGKGWRERGEEEVVEEEVIESDPKHARTPLTCKIVILFLFLFFSFVDPRDSTHKISSEIAAIRLQVYEKEKRREEK